MALDTYANLQLAIAAELHRSDLTSVIPDWITLAETKMNRTLKTAEMEASTTLTSTSGAPTISLPTGFKQARRVRMVYEDNFYDLYDYALMPAAWDESINVNQIPARYSIRGSTLVLRPTPDDAYPILMDYYAKFTPLSDSATTNWILTNYPDAYLYGALAHSAPWVGQDARITLWAQLFTDAIADINRQDFEKRFSQLQRGTDVPLSRVPYNVYYQ